MLSERPWTLEGMFRLMVGILGCLFCVLVTQSLAQHLVGKQKFASGTLLYVIFASAAIHGSILIGTAIALQWQGVGWNEMFGLAKRPWGRAIGYGVVAAIAFLPVGIVLQNISIEVLTHFSHVPPPAQEAIKEFTEVTTWYSRDYLIFFAVVLAPVAEEILFRGIIYGVLRQAGFPGAALWISSLLFAASHASAAIFIPLVVLGILFAKLYEMTDNLLASITAHGLFNAINLVFLFEGDALKDMFIRLLHQSHLR